MFRILRFMTSHFSTFHETHRTNLTQINWSRGLTIDAIFICRDSQLMLFYQLREIYPGSHSLNPSQLLKTIYNSFVELLFLKDINWICLDLYLFWRGHGFLGKILLFMCFSGLFLTLSPFLFILNVRELYRLSWYILNQKKSGRMPFFNITKQTETKGRLLSYVSLFTVDSALFSLHLGPKTRTCTQRLLNFDLLINAIWPRTALF